MLTMGGAGELESMLLVWNRTRGIAAQRTRTYCGFEGLWWPENLTKNTHWASGTQHWASAAGV
jgi:hypothetical protein